jgi:hypothetical protein
MKKSVFNLFIALGLLFCSLPVLAMELPDENNHFSKLPPEDKLNIVDYCTGHYNTVSLIDQGHLMKIFE